MGIHISRMLNSAQVLDHPHQKKHQTIEARSLQWNFRNGLNAAFVDVQRVLKEYTKWTIRENKRRDLQKALENHILPGGSPRQTNIAAQKGSKLGIAHAPQSQSQVNYVRVARRLESLSVRGAPTAQKKAKESRDCEAVAKQQGPVKDTFGEI